MKMSISVFMLFLNFELSLSTNLMFEKHSSMTELSNIHHIWFCLLLPKCLVVLPTATVLDSIHLVLNLNPNLSFSNPKFYFFTANMLLLKVHMKSTNSQWYYFYIALTVCPSASLFHCYQHQPHVSRCYSLIRKCPVRPAAGSIPARPSSAAGLPTSTAVPRSAGLPTTAAGLRWVI